ncbi:anti-sigma-D factor RsdA [Nocardia camponoti]|uniref:Anti-sigma-D factor RsdA sigma factor binding region domain-containing protein n=1 Tax=Nocardia camponoti TaxID=1616106 RepID=A0A917VAW9_9NOCA|nr:anti-sigma-D factor RsdA [Nocardia camponoti]GGK56858.1 hypothetical protein GCM10011591_31240 [Nocardia camponoti]
MARAGEVDDAGDSGPVDIAAVRGDDALIDAIASDGLVHTNSPEEFQLASLLADWRGELLSTPMPAGPNLDTVFAAVNQEIGARGVRVGASSRGRLRLVRPLLASAAALAVVFGGLTGLSYNAAPGDALWKVKEVVFSEQAQSTVVAQADGDLVAAQNLIAQGNPEQAKALLEQASNAAGQVNDPGKRDDLAARWHQLREQLMKVAPEIGAQLPKTTLPPATPKPTPPGSQQGPTSPGSTTAPVAPGTGVDPTITGGPGSSDKPTQPPVTTLPTTPPDTRPVAPPETTEPPVTTPPPVTTVPPVTTQPSLPPTTIAEPPPVTVPTAAPSSVPVVPTALPTLVPVPTAATIAPIPTAVPQQPVAPLPR